jgi:phospholipase C
VVVAPTNPQLPVQETGVRRARALPYALQANGHLKADKGLYVLDFLNEGSATAVFQVRSGTTADAPRCYTVEPGHALKGQWDLLSAGASRYDLSVSGPNGFLRRYQGGVAKSAVRVETSVVYTPVPGDEA